MAAGAAPAPGGAREQRQVVRSSSEKRGVPGCERLRLLPCQSDIPKAPGLREAQAGLRGRPSRGQDFLHGASGWINFRAGKSLVFSVLNELCLLLA